MADLAQDVDLLLGKVLQEVAEDNLSPAEVRIAC